MKPENKSLRLTTETNIHGDVKTNGGLYNSGEINTGGGPFSYTVNNYLSSDLDKDGSDQNILRSILRPLCADTVHAIHHNQLQDEFYEGGYTRFEHILAGLDFLRDEKLTAIAQAFTKRNIVIIHAASGQGKTTLAYRYLYNNYTADKLFVIERIQDLRHAATIASALLDFVATQREPIAVYMNVHPQDADWTEVARQLAHQPNLHLLITIREEDFQRANVAALVFSRKKSI